MQNPIKSLAVTDGKTPRRAFLQTCALAGTGLFLVNHAAVTPFVAAGAKEVFPVCDYSTFDAKQWVLIEGKTKVTEAEDATGKKRSVLVLDSKKQVVHLRDFSFCCGAIEAEFKGGAWLGLSFRVTDDGNQAEIIYFRNPKVDGWEKSIRYYCRKSSLGNGKFEEITGVDSGTIPLPPEAKGDDLLKPDGWVKLKCVVAGKRADIYLDGADKPVFTIDSLHLAGKYGSVGVYGWRGAFAGFRVQKSC